MKINRMAVVQGLNLEPVPGQLRYGCGMTDFEDFYDIAEYVNEKAYLGNQIVFGDYETGEMYTPFEKERNIAYGGVEWIEGYFYFLKADFSKKTVAIMQYRPDWDCKEYFSIGMAEVELYNLRIVGTPIHLIVRNRFGDVVSEEPGALTRLPNGQWWLS